MKVIRYKKDNIEHYFDYNEVISMLKENDGIALFCICRRTYVDENSNKIEMETLDIKITAEKLLLDDAFEIKYFPFTREECIQLQLRNTNYDVTLKLSDYMREMQIIQYKTEMRM